jgi:hypothetical protein
LTWELPVERAPVEQALNIKFDIDPAAAATMNAEQLRLNGERVDVRHDSGQWRPAD